jgi:hypothetical protein
VRTDRRAINGAEALAFAHSVVISELPLNPHEFIRAEIIDRRGKPIVVISRWKTASSGLKRTGVSFEFAAHRIAGVAKVISDLQRVLVPDKTDGDQQSAVRLIKCQLAPWLRLTRKTSASSVQRALALGNGSVAPRIDDANDRKS